MGRQVSTLTQRSRDFGGFLHRGVFIPGYYCRCYAHSEGGSGEPSRHNGGSGVVQQRLGKISRVACHNRTKSGRINRPLCRKECWWGCAVPYTFVIADRRRSGAGLSRRRGVRVAWNTGGAGSGWVARWEGDRGGGDASGTGADDRCSWGGTATTKHVEAAKTAAATAIGPVPAEAVGVADNLLKAAVDDRLPRVAALLQLLAELTDAFLDLRDLLLSPFWRWTSNCLPSSSPSWVLSLSRSPVFSASPSWRLS